MCCWIRFVWPHGRRNARTGVPAQWGLIFLPGWAQGWCGAWGLPSPCLSAAQEPVDEDMLDYLLCQELFRLEPVVCGPEEDIHLGTHLVLPLIGPAVEASSSLAGTSPEMGEDLGTQAGVIGGFLPVRVWYARWALLVGVGKGNQWVRSSWVIASRFWTISWFSLVALTSSRWCVTGLKAWPKGENVSLSACILHHCDVWLVGKHTDSGHSGWVEQKSPLIESKTWDLWAM